MSKISFGSPWGYAGAGLAGGLAQGLALGGEMEDRKQRREQAKRQEEQANRKGAIDLLIAGSKISDEHPQLMQQFVGYASKALGVPLDMGTAVPAIERFKKANAEAIAAGMTPEQANNWAFQTVGKTAPKGGKEADQHYMMTPQGVVPVPPGKYHNMPSTMIPQTYFNAQDPSQKFNMPPGSHPLPQQPAWQVPQTTETESGLTAGDLKPFDALEAKYNATQDPAERAAIEKRITEAGGTVEKIPQPKGFFGGVNPDKIMVVPPATKKRTSTKTPGLGGVPEPRGGADAGAVKAKAKELIQKGKDPAKVKAWAASKGVTLE